MKILALHGYRQSPTTFRQKTGSFRKLVSKLHAEFIFAEAPHVICEEQRLEMTTGQKIDMDPELCRGWWFSRNNNWYKALDVTDCDKGFDESLSYIFNLFETEGPFDGILAFSQGSALAIILTCLKEKKLNSIVNHKFNVLVAPFFSQCELHQHYYENVALETPSLLVYGKSDTVVPMPYSKEVVKLFKNNTIIEHDGGHFFVANAKIKQTYIDFLSKFRISSPES